MRVLTVFAFAAVAVLHYAVPWRAARARIVSDDRLVHRVRATLGHFTSHPRSIGVAAAGGRVTLRGAVLASERADLVAAVRRVDGVRALDDRLTTYLDAIGVPELQGGASPRQAARRE